MTNTDSDKSKEWAAEAYALLKKRQEEQKLELLKEEEQKLEILFKRKKLRKILTYIYTIIIGENLRQNIFFFKKKLMDKFNKKTIS